jgi:hypothetical protein
VTSVTDPTGTGFEPAAWAWVDHLRHGGSTPWLAWVGSDHPAVRAAAARVLPGAAQLEVVRRMADRRTRGAGDAPLDFPALADVVLDRSGPGRGLGQLPLLWPAAHGDPARVGAPPTDPATVPTEELVRVGVGALVDLLQRGAGEPPARPAGPRRRPWSRQYHLAGAPATVSRVRSGFEAAGHTEGGWRPHVVLFAPPFDALLGQVWSARVQGGAAVRWTTFLGKWANRHDLPPSADVAAIAARWKARVGAEHVHVVAPDADGWDDHRARRTAGEILGLRPGEPAQPPEVRSLSAAGVDVVRRVNRLLRVRVTPDESRVLLRRLRPVLAAQDGHGGPGLHVPGHRTEWVRGRAERAIEGLANGGYAVHGDLDRIAPSGPGRVRPPKRDVLELVLDACLRAGETAAETGLTPT